MTTTDHYPLQCESRLGGECIKSRVVLPTSKIWPPETCTHLEEYKGEIRSETPDARSEAMMLLPIVSAQVKHCDISDGNFRTKLLSENAAMRAQLAVH